MPGDDDDDLVPVPATATGLGVRWERQDTLPGCDDDGGLELRDGAWTSATTCDETETGG